MKVIVCGSRDWTEVTPVFTFLKGLMPGDITVIHGDARGADRLASGVAYGLGMKVRAFPADWETHGRAAGFIRNEQMLQEEPDLVVAFKNDFNWKLDKGGTEHMVRIAKEKGVPTYVISRA